MASDALRALKMTRAPRSARTAGTHEANRLSCRAVETRPITGSNESRKVGSNATCGERPGQRGQRDRAPASSSCSSPCRSPRRAGASRPGRSRGRRCASAGRRTRTARRSWCRSPARTGPPAGGSSSGAAEKNPAMPLPGHLRGRRLLAVGAARDRVGRATGDRQPRPRRRQRQQDGDAQNRPRHATCSSPTPPPASAVSARRSCSAPRAGPGSRSGRPGSCRRCRRRRASRTRANPARPRPADRVASARS